MHLGLKISIYVLYGLFSFPQVVAVYGTLSDLLSVASNKLGIRATNLYNGKGGLIDDIALIRWEPQLDVPNVSVLLRSLLLFCSSSLET